MGQQVGGIDPVKDAKAYAVAQNYIQEQLRNADASDRISGNRARSQSIESRAAASEFR